MADISTIPQGWNLSTEPKITWLKAILSLSLYRSSINLTSRMFDHHYIRVCLSLSISFQTVASFEWQRPNHRTETSQTQRERKETIEKRQTQLVGGRKRVEREKERKTFVQWMEESSNPVRTVTRLWPSWIEKEAKDRRWNRSVKWMPMQLCTRFVDYSRTTTILLVLWLDGQRHEDRKTSQQRNEEKKRASG